MNPLTPLILIGLLVLPLSTPALSRSIHRDIEFPKNYDTNLANQIRQVIQDEQFKFVEGIVSYWPPDWPTRLSFEGDKESLNTFIARIRDVKAIGLQLILYKGRDDERRRDSDWQLLFSHARPKQLTIYLNLNSTNIQFDKLNLPEWKPQN